MEEMKLHMGSTSFEICSECGLWALYVRDCSGKLTLLLTEMKYCLLTAFTKTAHVVKKKVMVEKSCQQNFCKKLMNISGGILIDVLNIKKLQEELHITH